MPLKSFRELDYAETVAHEAWGAHVDTCFQCARSVFACKKQMELHERWNSAWWAAKRVWDQMTDEEKASFRVAAGADGPPGQPETPAPAAEGPETEAGGEGRTDDAT